MSCETERRGKPFPRNRESALI